MPHNVPEEKEWLHLRDAICLGDVDVIVDQLFKEGIPITYVEMERELISLKTNLGWDACAVVDKETFQESINELISESIAIPQPQDAPEFRTYKDSLADGRWNRIFDDMVARASSRIESGPSHFTAVDHAAHNVSHHPGKPRTKDYHVSLPKTGEWRPSHFTEKTPEGALEAMERRLSSGFSQEMVEALAQMELRVGELADAVRQMGGSVPAPIVEAVEAVETAVEAVQAEEPREGSKQGIIYAYLSSLTPEQFAETGNLQVAAHLTRLNPQVSTFTSGNISDFYYNYAHLDLPRLRGRGPAPMPGVRMPQRGKALIVANYLVGLGADAQNTDLETFVEGINAGNPGLASPITIHDYYSTVSNYPNLPRISLLGRGAGGGGSTSISIEDRIRRGYQRPERYSYGF